MVQEIEEFRTELESITFAESPILRQREVDVRDRLASNGALAKRAKLSCLRHREGGRIQVLCWIARIQIERRACIVRPLSHRAGCSESIRTRNQLDRSRTEVRNNAVQLPTTQGKLGALTPISERRQLVDDVTYERVSSIEVCVTPVAIEVEWIARRVSNEVSATSEIEWPHV